MFSNHKVNTSTSGSFKRRLGRFLDEYDKYLDIQALPRVDQLAFCRHIALLRSCVKTNRHDVEFLAMNVDSKNYYNTMHFTGETHLEKVPQFWSANDKDTALES